MRRNIVHIGAGELSYEIRQIAEVAGRIQKLSGEPIRWENIGDPVQKGERIPDWQTALPEEEFHPESTVSAHDSPE